MGDEHVGYNRSIAPGPLGATGPRRHTGGWDRDFLRPLLRAFCIGGEAPWMTG